MSNVASGKPPRSWRRIALITLAGTAACLVLSLAVNYLLLFNETLTPFGHSVASAAILPLLIGIPVFLFLGTRLEEIRRYRRELTRAASYDGQTGLFNSSAFGTMIERRTGPTQPAGRRHGAFLIIEIGKLREINMRYGRAWGDEALKVVVETIRATVRSDDIVGRISTNEFGVFLPGATEANALEVGERIRADIGAAYFGPAGETGLLDVSVGGVVFERDLTFDDMFRAAEELLVEAGPADRLRLSFIDRDPGPMAH